MPPRVITMLTGVKTAELSVVPDGANNKRFALSKEHEMLLSEVLKNLIGTKAEGEDDLKAKLEKAGLSGDALEAAIASYRVQHGYADKLSKESVVAIAKAAGFDLTEKADDDDDTPPPKKKKPDDKPAFLNKEAAEQIATMQKSIDEQKAANEQLSKELSGVKRGALRKELIVECEKEFAHVPGMSAEEQADTLLKAKDAGGDLEETIRKQWAATSEAISKSDLLRPAGTGGGGGSGDAAGQLDTLAKELITKDTKLSYAKAYDLAMQQNPSLYKEYLNQNPAQTARTYR
jgi:hypothetical protein